MRTQTPQTIYLKNYTPYPYTLDHVDLNFDLREGHTIVDATLSFETKDANAPLFLHGKDLELLSLTLDGKAIEHTIDDSGLTIKSPPQKAFTLHIQTKIYPEKNTALQGLYKSGDTYCTQCEAEGFRNITYFPDRPDVLATYTTRIEADAQSYPVLLGNGNRVDGGEADNGRHFTIWEDPFPKPCYLFALVAGNLAHIHDTFTTKSGREVDLYIFVRPGDEPQCGHAMESLKKSMKWDEDVYGLEYDLDLFNIVAVSDFNMGAMENKSLNIFNTALVLAAQETATDTDFGRVESVIAHEYFHNWSGNRVTCRDWFQLSLKEGLTVFRDQEFSSDLNSRPVQRIDDVTHLRRFQFPEDAGPLAHPIRPDNYIEINNFYTMTVYEKGAEVIRMMHTIIGAENYRKGTDLYFSRHDGDAATCDDFIKCMEDASGVDLTHFKLWYGQAGTPVVTFKEDYNKAEKRYSAIFTQNIPDTPGQTHKKPMHIPIGFGLLDSNGKEMKNTILHLTESSQTFTFDNISEKPVPSVLRGFSAPVKLKHDLGNDVLSFLMRHDNDPFNRWESAQTLGLRTVLDLVKDKDVDTSSYITAYTNLLEQALESTADKAFMARMLTLPDVGFIAQQQEHADPSAVYTAHNNLLRTIKRECRKLLDKLYAENLTGEGFEITPHAMGQRALQNTALYILTITGGTGCRRRAKEQYDSANNMTDRLAALSVLARISCEEATDALNDFHTRYKDYPLVIDKWFAIQASAPRKDIVEILGNLRNHRDFNIKNPNRARSLYAAFAMNNPAFFHAADGSGYNFLTDAILELNTVNPQIAARLLGPMRDWRSYTPDRQEKMKACLERIMAEKELSPNVFEIASKSLNA